jgi:hypothetical protein
MFFNQHHALSHSGYSSKEVCKQLEKTITIFEKQIKENKQHIINHINTNSEVQRKVNQICQIKGVDILTVATILAETNGFELFKNQGQLVSYAGYDVIENQSGNHTGKTRISKRGNGRIRRILHMPAFNVVRFKQTDFVNLYQRIYNKTKIKMKAYVAVQKKLLIVMYTLWKKDQTFKNSYNKKLTSGNEEHRALFPFFTEGEITTDNKIVVPPYSSTTQDGLRYNVSHEALLPLPQT